jgi:iron complex outermembrane receptor protein
MKCWLLLLCLLPLSLFGQQEEVEADTILLEELVVKAYQSNRPVSEVPAAIGIVDPAVMNRFANTSFVSAANTVPGVRMEERSPGSYRFSIRGSLLRSPFGVRNVKFYWRGLPFTDGGGNTYLNLLDFSTVRSMEVIKGPGSSLYGAGTGGVVLMEPFSDNRIRARMLGGSYGMFQVGASVPVMFTPKDKLAISGGWQRSNGYRNQTAMGRLGAGLDYTHFTESGAIRAILFTSTLDYQTPGGLTLAQFEEDPRQARPATATIPGAAEQQAAIRNQMLIAGLSYENDWNEHWSTSIGLLASSNTFKNPAILNYEKREEANYALRASTDYFFGTSSRQKITFGVEAQRFTSDVDVSSNDGGVMGTLITSDDLASSGAFAFLQADMQLPAHFYLTLGGSANFLKYRMERTYPVENVEALDFEPGLFPRIALLKKFRDLSVYATWSDGFSAPTFAELLPNTGVYNQDLEPERGTNLEGGLKADILNKHLHLGLTVYDFKLKNAIVNVSGGDDFQNAGSTSQRGVEANASWSAGLKKLSLRLWGSYAYNNYYFDEYVRAGNVFSGNELTGVPRHVIVGGADVTFKGWYLNPTVNRTSALPLNDANTEYAADYLVMGVRGGKLIDRPSFKLDLFAGADNLLDQDYSLGNDLNAAGGRYYNAAPGRNFFFGVGFSPAR